MARVFVDPHMFGCDWFGFILPELEGSKRVRFLFSNCAKGRKELQSYRKALEFERLMRARGRAVSADSSLVEAQVEYLNSHGEFRACRDCDDPHIMAAIYIHPTKYVFSEDKRLAGCRSRMTGVVKSRYCSFVVIGTSSVYQYHRSSILS